MKIDDKMPLLDFMWSPKEELELLNDFFKHRNEGLMLKWSDVFDEDIGFFIEADLSFTDEAKEKLRDFPPAPHHCTLMEDQISEFSKGLLDAEKIKFQPSRKLCITLLEKVLRE